VAYGFSGSIATAMKSTKLSGVGMPPVSTVEGFPRIITRVFATTFISLRTAASKNQFLCVFVF